MSSAKVVFFFFPMKKDRGFKNSVRLPEDSSVPILGLYRCFPGGTEVTGNKIE